MPLILSLERQSLRQVEFCEKEAGLVYTERVLSWKELSCISLSQ